MKMEWDEEFDFVCVGSGCGGMAGAATASICGARVLLIEKTEMLGGLTAYSEGEIWIPANSMQQKEGIEDSYEEALRYLSFLSAGLGSAELREHFTRKSNEAIKFLEENAGLKLGIIPNRIDYFYPEGPGSLGPGRYLESDAFDTRQLGDFENLLMVSPFSSSRVTQRDVAAVGAVRDETKPDNLKDGLNDIVARRTEQHELCGGAGLMAQLINAALSHGAQIRLNTRLERLITDAGRVHGVEVSTPEGSRFIKARGVLLASGGYDWNPELVRLYEQRTDLHTVTTPNQTGDHMIIAGDVGAAVAMRPPFFTPLLNGTRVPDPTNPKELFSIPLFAGRPHMIFVNREGNRFADEAFHPAMHAAQLQFDGVTMTFPNLPTWYVFDQNFRDKYSVGPYGPGDPLPEGLVSEAHSIKELAQQIGVNPENLFATIKRFNSFCEQGEDHDFGRGTRPWSIISIGDDSMPNNKVLGPLNKAPFYAIKLIQLTAGVPSAGLKIDGKARVIGSRDTPIGGLYAAGNAAGIVDTFGYQSGMSIARGITQGYVAGCDITSNSSHGAVAYETSSLPEQA